MNELQQIIGKTRPLDDEHSNLTSSKRTKESTNDEKLYTMISSAFEQDIVDQISKNIIKKFGKNPYSEMNLPYFNIYLKKFVDDTMKTTKEKIVSLAIEASSPLLSLNQEKPECVNLAASFLNPLDLSNLSLTHRSMSNVIHSGCNSKIFIIKNQETLYQHIKYLSNKKFLPCITMEKISLSGEGFDIEQFQNLRKYFNIMLPLIAEKFPNLKYLEITNCKEVSTQWLTAIGSLTKLECLFIRNSRIAENANLLALTKLKKLRILDLVLEGGNNKIFEFIPSIENLKELFLENIQFTSVEDCTEMNQKFPNLTRLTIKNSEEINAQGLETIGHFSNLKYLAIHHSHISHSSALSHLQKLKKLHTLDLKFSEGIDIEGLEYISNIENLRELHLESVSFVNVEGDAETDDTVALILSTNEVIEYLDLSYFNLTDRGLADLAQMKNLKGLDLFLCESITDEGLIPLSANKKLKILKLTDCNQITDESIRHLSTIEGLEELDLTGCYNITNDSLQALSRIKGLKILKLNGCKNITDEGISHLTAFERLEELSLSDCINITDNAMQYVACHALSLLRLSIHGEVDQGYIEDGETMLITDQGVAFLRPLSKLQYLNLSCTRITDKALLDVSRYFPKLKTLLLWGCNEITDEGVNQLPHINTLDTRECNKLSFYYEP